MLRIASSARQALIVARIVSSGLALAWPEVRLFVLALRCLFLAYAIDFFVRLRRAGLLRRRPR